MSTDTISSNWGAVAIASVSGEVGLGARGTLYVYRNFDTGERFLYALVDLGFGLGVGFSISEEIKQLFKATTSGKNMDDPTVYTLIPVHNPFSASDLHLASGSEATAGVTVAILGASITLVSAWSFFQSAPEPGQEVNNDYFSGAQIISNGFDLGLQAKAAYQFMGRWIKLWSF